MAEAPEMHKILFANLIMMLSQSAMQQLGKLVNPMTGKTEVSLEGARMTIDMLEMIEAKTKGNLDAEEEKMLKDLLSNLHLNYVETSQNPPAEEPAEDKKEDGETPDDAAEDKAEDDKDSGKKKAESE